LLLQEKVEGDVKSGEGRKAPISKTTKTNKHGLNAYCLGLSVRENKRGADERINI
jgi:hypothetical protein